MTCKAVIWAFPGVRKKKDLKLFSITIQNATKMILRFIYTFMCLLFCFITTFKNRNQQWWLKKQNKIIFIIATKTLCGRFYFICLKGICGHTTFIQ